MTALPRIQRLSDTLISQIAAGEVVERPSSIIKELIENSLDAGARRIDLILKDGGMNEITVVDDGHGISEEDLPLAIERHATSKVSRLEDLEAIGTFGFRGEALASIASVATLEITSRTAAMEKAARIAVEFGVPSPIQYVASPSGTRVTVRGLFERIPARLKFLRSPSTEFSHCARVLKEIALGNPEVAFFLHHQGKQSASFATGTRLTRFNDCYKPQWQPLHFQETATGLSAEGYLSPAHHLADRGEISLFINGRPVRQKTLTSAIRNAYLNTLGAHHEPSGVVFLDVQPEWVDVNVHPQKWEVRILRQDSLYAWLMSSLRRMLEKEKTELAPELFEDTAAGNSARLPYPSTIAHLSFTAPASSAFRYLGTVRDEFWLYETTTGLSVVHLEKLNRRLHRQRLKTHGSVPRKLALPLVLQLSAANAALSTKHRSALDKLGFEFEIYDDKDLALRSVPEVVAHAHLESSLLACLAYLENETGENPFEILSGFGDEEPLKQLDPFRIEHVLRDLEPTDDFSAEISFESLNGLLKKGKAP